MKANGLSGDYCQTCAGILNDAILHKRRLIALDSDCLRIFQQSGDAALIEGHDNAPPALPVYQEQKASEKIKETVKAPAPKIVSKKSSR